MSTWLQAHRAANFAAAQAHGELGVDPATFPIDVYAAIASADVKLMWRPLPRAFGFYLDRPHPGILINNRPEPAVQRHTAAHELGHHLLGHGKCADVDVDVFETTRRSWPEPEKAAEAFAVWFLMPRRAVLAAMRTLNLTRLSEPDEVYQLSLLLGTSYRSTARHLPNLRLCTTAQSRSWMGVPPGRLKHRLDPGMLPASRAPDVWRIDRRFAGAVLTAAPGDRLVLDLTTQATISHTVVHISSDDSDVPMRVVPRRSSHRHIGPTPSPASEQCLTVELAPDDPSMADLLEIHVGEIGDSQSWTIWLKVEQTRWGPVRTTKTTTDNEAARTSGTGVRRTLTVNAREDTLI